MEIDCPKCEQTIDLDKYDMPQRACDDMEITCENETCEHDFSVGWYPTAEIR